MLALDLLGPVVLRRDDRVLPLALKKLQALLLLLARAGRQPRARVVAMLWPQLDEPTGRRNLRRELARLRELGAADVVQVDGDALALAPGVSCDAAAFEAELAAGRADEALARWRGPLADDLALDEAGPFADWLGAERMRLAAARQRALQASAAAREARGALEPALQRVQALLDDDPLQERHHRDAMRLLAALGRREAALAQYERCRALLASELGLAPMAETEAQAAALRGAGPAPAPVPVSLPAAAARLPEPLPFAGRHERIVQLEAAWRAGAAVVLEGEAGVGKTRLALDFAAAHGPLALARCRPGDAELPYAAIARALRGLGATGAALDGLPPWVAPELARLLPELGPAPPPLHSADERRRFYEACHLAWQRLAGDNFDAVVFDDWHLADDASRALLAFLAQRRREAGAGGAREWLLTRPAPGTAALAESLQALHCTLPPLAGHEVLDLVAALSGADRPQRFAAHLAALTAGNPFYIGETLRHWAARGWLRAGADGRWHTPFDDSTADYRELGVPGSVLEAVRGRVARLPAAAQRVLEAAALAGEPFHPGLLAPACALSELDAVLAIEQALEARLLREHDGGGYAFAHDLVQQALEDALSPQRRRLVHRRLALGAEAGGVPAAVVAWHHEAAGEPARAVAFRLRAGDEAQALQAPLEALAQWQKALDDGPTPAQALVLHQHAARMARLRDDPGRHLAHVDALLALADGGQLEPAQALEARIAAAGQLAMVRQMARALALLDALPSPLPPGLAAAALVARADALSGQAGTEAARAAIVAALAQPDLEPRMRVELNSRLVLMAQWVGRGQEALRHLDELVAVATAQGDRFAIARAHDVRGALYQELGDYDAAEAELRQAERQLGQLGFVHVQRVALYNLAVVHSSAGRPRGVLEAAARGWALQPPCPPGELRVMYRLAFIDAHLALGELGAGWAHAAPLLEECAALDGPDVLMSVAMSTLELLALVGEQDRAAPLLAAIDRLRIEQAPYAAIECAVVRAELALQAGDAGQARRLLQSVPAPAADSNVRVRCRHAIAAAALQLAEGRADAALATLPDEADPGLNDELRLRALRVRVDAAAAAAGRLPPALAAACGRALAVPDAHAAAALALWRALAAMAGAGRPGAPADAAAAWAQRRRTLAASLADWPAQQAAFLRGA